MKCNDKQLYLITNEKDETVGVYFAVSQSELEKFIDNNKLYPRTQIKIVKYKLDDSMENDVIPVINTQRHLWYELKHRHSIHVVQ